MKRLAGMQPYFFPYIGYWQLISAVDCFILFDEAQYMKQGWVNRNRVLKPDGGWQYITVPLKKHAMTDSIRSVEVHPDDKWKDLIIRQLAHYKKKARFFQETKQLVEKIIFGTDEKSIAAINCFAIKGVCKHLGLSKEIIISSERGFDYSDVGGPGDWALRHSEQMGATELINPIAGAPLFDGDKFASSNIRLSFLETADVSYPHPSDFEPSLSVIDVLMFNGVEGTRKLLDSYIIHTKDA